jgi:cephalosporin-C deacetylase
MNILKISLLSFIFLSSTTSPNFVKTTFSGERELGLETSFDFGNGDGTAAYGQPIIIRYQVKNHTLATVRGAVGGSVSTLQKKAVHNFQQTVEIPPKQSKIFTFKYLPTQAGIYSVYANLKNSKAVLSANSILMGYAVDKIQASLTRQPDFDIFWKTTQQELSKITPQFKMISKPEISKTIYDVYLVEMQSFDNMTIKAWYRVPTQKSKSPVIIQIPSLGGSFFDTKSLDEKPKHGVPYDFAVLSLNIRGHGNSKTDIDVGENYTDLVTYNLAERDLYFYRGAVMDCIRAIDFLMTRSEIDKSQIVIEGASQGGALSLIASALDNRVKLCLPDVPFLSDMDNLIREADWFAQALNQYARQEKIPLTQLKYNLTYFDTKNFADKIKVPVYMSVGLQDNVCPAVTSLATYSKITSAKICHIYPWGKHEGGAEVHRVKKFAWIRKQFGMPED